MKLGLFVRRAGFAVDLPACMPPAGAEGIETLSRMSAPGLITSGRACMPPAGAEGIETGGGKTRP